MFNIQVQSVGQAQAIREFYEDRYDMVHGVDFKITLGACVLVQDDVPNREQLMFKFF